jgi:uncharacterized membrane protein YphA (DoxX/SURF4 family)
MIVVARLLLATLFAVAGAAKLADRRGTRQVLRDFGVPGRFGASLALLLPLAELGLAAALVPDTSARLAAAAAAALLALFMLAIANVLRQGRELDCNCFGRLHSSHAGWKALARNALLAVLALLVAVTGPGDGLSLLHGVEPSPTTLGVFAAVLVDAFLAWLGWQLVRQNGRLLERVRTLEERGTAAV